MMHAQSTPSAGWGRGSEGELGYGTSGANLGGICSVFYDLNMYIFNADLNRSYGHNG